MVVEAAQVLDGRDGTADSQLFSDMPRATEHQTHTNIVLPRLEPPLLSQHRDYLESHLNTCRIRLRTLRAEIGLFQERFSSFLAKTRSTSVLAIYSITQA